METQQSIWRPNGQSWETPLESSDAQLVFLFGGRDALKNEAAIAELENRFTGAHFVGCSTAGEINGVEVSDDSLVATAVHFDRTRVEIASLNLDDADNSTDAGKKLAQKVNASDLVHVLVLSDGIDVNGSELVAGLTAELPAHVTVTGGLSADGDRFEETLVVADRSVCARQLVAVGLYGDALKVGYASLGGWDQFGPERTVTRSEGNVLYELDGKSALQLYREYLGEHADGLPATGLLFPLAVRKGLDDEPVVRTILGIDEEAQSMTFAGDIPQGSLARLMKANFDRLVDGAADAAKTSHSALGDFSPDLAILISCVGRKMVLKQRVEEEVEAVREVLGDSTTLTGFYSYGEISPFTPNAKCELHNQTMTITAFSED